jgi:hypothetical protein
MEELGGPPRSFDSQKWCQRLPCVHRIPESGPGFVTPVSALSPIDRFHRLCVIPLAGRRPNRQDSVYLG